MAIKPIDLQVMMPRVNEISRIQNNEQQRSLAIQQNKVQTTERQSENSMKQVNSKEESQKVIIQERQQKEKKESRQNKKEKQQQEEKNQQNPGKGKPSGKTTIDIRL